MLAFELEVVEVYSSFQNMDNSYMRIYVACPEEKITSWM
jgi:hypothetical protein